MFANDAVMFPALLSAALGVTFIVWWFFFKDEDE